MNGEPENLQKMCNSIDDKQHVQDNKLDNHSTDSQNEANVNVENTTKYCQDTCMVEPLESSEDLFFSACPKGLSVMEPSQPTDPEDIANDIFECPKTAEIDLSKEDSLEKIEIDLVSEYSHVDPICSRATEPSIAADGVIGEDPSILNKMDGSSKRVYLPGPEPEVEHSSEGFHAFGDHQTPTICNTMGTLPKRQANPINEITSLKEALKTLAEAATLQNLYESISSYNIPRAIFIIGATGFVGRHITGHLLTMTPASTKIHCLVRANTPDSGRERVKISLKEAGLWDDQFENRLIIYCGNLLLPIMGLSAKTFRTLCETMDTVVHMGSVAPVKFYGRSEDDTTLYKNAPRDSLLGLNSILRLVVTNKIKPLHMITPLFMNRTILSLQKPNEEQILMENSLEVDGVWLNDHFPFRSSHAGGPLWSAIALEEIANYGIQLNLPFKIYRVPPLFIGGNQGDTESIFIRLLQLMLLTRTAPTRQDGTIPFPIFSADTVCHRIARLMSLPCKMMQHSIYQCVPKMQDASTLLFPQASEINRYIREFGLYDDANIEQPYLKLVTWDEFKDQSQALFQSGWASNSTLLKKMKQFFCPMSEDFCKVWYSEQQNSDQEQKKLYIDNSHTRELMSRSERYFQALRKGQNTSPFLDTVYTAMRIQEPSLNGRENSTYMPWPPSKTVFNQALSVSLMAFSEVTIRTSITYQPAEMSPKAIAHRKIDHIFMSLSNMLQSKLVSRIENIEKGICPGVLDLREMGFWYGITDRKVKEMSRDRVRGFGSDDDEQEKITDPTLIKFYEAKVEMWKAYCVDHEHPMIILAIEGFTQLYTCFLLESKRTLIREAVLFKIVTNAAINILCFLRWDHERCWRLNNFLKAKRSSKSGTTGESLNPPNIPMPGRSVDVSLDDDLNHYPTSVEDEEYVSTPPAIRLMGNVVVTPCGILRKEELVTRITDRTLFVTSPDGGLAQYASTLLGMDPHSFMVPYSAEMMSPCTFSKDGWPEAYTSYYPVKEAIHKNQNHMTQTRCEEAYGGTLWGGKKGTVAAGIASARESTDIWAGYTSRLAQEDDMAILQNLPFIHDSRCISNEMLYKRRTPLGGGGVTNHTSATPCYRELEGLRDEVVPVTRMFELLGRSPSYYDWMYVPSYNKWLYNKDCHELKRALPYVKQFIKFIIWCRTTLNLKEAVMTPPSGGTAEPEMHLPRMVVNLPNSLWGVLPELLGETFNQADVLTIHCAPQWSVKSSWENLSSSSWLMSESYETGLTHQLYEHPKVMHLRSLKTQEVLNMKRLLLESSLSQNNAMKTTGDVEYNENYEVDRTSPKVNLRTPFTSNVDLHFNTLPAQEDGTWNDEGSDVAVLTTSEYKQLVASPTEGGDIPEDEPVTEESIHRNMMLDRTFAGACEELLRVRVKAAVTQGFEEYMSVRASISPIRHMPLNCTKGNTLDSLPTNKTDFEPVSSTPIFFDVSVKDLLEDPSAALSIITQRPVTSWTPMSPVMDLLRAPSTPGSMAQTTVTDALTSVFKDDIFTRSANLMWHHPNGHLKAIQKRMDNGPTGFPTALAEYHPHEFEKYCNRFCPRKVSSTTPILKSMTQSINSTLAGLQQQMQQPPRPVGARPMNLGAREQQAASNSLFSNFMRTIGVRKN